MKIVLCILAASIASVASVAYHVSHMVTRRSTAQLTMVAKADLPTTDEGWLTRLDPNQFAVLRKAATEPSGFSEKYKLSFSLLPRSMVTIISFSKHGRATRVHSQEGIGHESTQGGRIYLRSLRGATILRQNQV